MVEPRTNLHMRAPETIREIAPENRIQPPPLLPRPPIQRQQEVYLDQEQPGRNRLASNKRRWSHERDDEEEEQDDDDVGAGGGRPLPVPQQAVRDGPDVGHLNNSCCFVLGGSRYYGEVWRYLPGCTGVDKT